MTVEPCPHWEYFILASVGSFISQSCIPTITGSLIGVQSSPCLDSHCFQRSVEVILCFLKKIFEGFSLSRVTSILGLDSTWSKSALFSSSIYLCSGNTLSNLSKHLSSFAHTGPWSSTNGVHDSWFRFHPEPL